MGPAATDRTRSVLLAAGSGLALWAAHPPVAQPLAAWTVAPLLVLALRAASGAHPLDEGSAPPSARRAFLLGTVAGTVAFGAMLHWIAYAGGAVAWILLAGIQACWFGLWAVVVRPVLASPLLPLHGALVWAGIEWLRTLWPLGGFAWGRLAPSQIDVAWFLPLGRTLGASGIGLVVVLVGLAGLQVTAALRRDRMTPPRIAAAQLLLPLFGVTLLTVGAPTTAGSLDVLAVQGNDIRHWEAPVADAPLVIARNHRDVTLAAVGRDGPPDLTVWPESSLDRDPSRARGVALWEAAAEAVAAAGTLVAGVSLDGPDPARQRVVGAVVLDGTGETARYVKRRPVPFGEYVPARSVLGGLAVLAPIPRDAVRGEEAVALEVAPGVFAAIAYCFETVFPAVVRTNVLAGPEPAGIVLTLTNDASFRDSAQPEQHLAQSRLRAVETGRWVVHAAISGVSAVIDPDGRVVARTEPFTLTSLRYDVPLVTGRTPHLVLGEVVGPAGALVAAGTLVGSLSGRRRRRGPSPRRPAA